MVLLQNSVDQLREAPVGPAMRHWLTNRHERVEKTMDAFFRLLRGVIGGFMTCRSRESGEWRHFSDEACSILVVEAILIDDNSSVI